MHQPLAQRTPQPTQPAQPARQAQPAIAGGASGELAALDARRDELRNQLQSLTERRALLETQSRMADGTAKQELQSRLTAIDARVARIDDELNSIDDQMDAALARGTARPSGMDQLIRGTLMRPPSPPFVVTRDFTKGFIELIVGQSIGFLLIAFVLWRWLRRRGGAVPRLAAEDVARIDQLQRSIDVMAVEIERISEGQRYVAKTLGEKVPVNRIEAQ
jgi:hypothetical protein